MQTVTVRRLGREGDGMAGDIRVPFSLPGETWSGVADDRGILTEATLLSAGTDRTDPPCLHFGACGGCTLQHAAGSFLAGWKAETIRHALAAQGLDTDIRPTLTSPPRSRRRAVLTGRRTRKTVTVGFHSRRSETLVAVRHCHVLQPEIVAALPVFERLTGIGASRSGAVRLTVTAGPSGLDVTVRDARPMDFAMQTKLVQIAGDAGLARLNWNGVTVVQIRTPWQQFGPAMVIPPPGAFLQATAEGEAALVRFVTSTVGTARRVADLFCGCGTFTLPLARSADILAVEGEAEMVTALDEGWRQTAGLHRVVARSRDLFRRPLMPQELKGFEAVVIDPPRAGAQAQTEEIARSEIQLVAAVSCNPATFARDARILCDAGFTLEQVLPVDQFLWSGHVELAASFVRN